MYKKSITLKLLIILVIIVLGSGANWFISRPKSNQAESKPSATSLQKPGSSVEPQATQFPFQEMTIPFLRARSYNSSLSELDQVSYNDAYTSYLTSYNSDQLKINALITQPKGEQPAGGWPAIVFIHGYIPPTQYRTQERYIAYVDNLARNGFVVFKIDLRGHGNSDGDASGAYYSSDYIIDVLNAHAVLRAVSFVNPQSIGLWGHSMAGNVVLRTMAVQPQIPAAVIWAGAVYSYEDLQKYGLSDASYRPPTQDGERQRRRQLLFDTYGQFNPGSDFWKQVAATNYLDDFEGAIQLHHAVDDTVVSIGYSRDLKQHLDQAGVANEVYEYSSGGHDIEGSSFGTAMQRTVTFFKDNLLLQGT